MVTGMSRRRYTHVDKNRWLRMFQSSSQTAAEFCRSHQLSYQTFSRWKRLDSLKHQASGRSCEFIELELPTTPPLQSTVTHRLPHVELDLGQGVVVRIFQPQTSLLP
jgi:transposase-like protein